MRHQNHKISHVRAFLCNPADRLADGPVRVPWAVPAQRDHLSKPMGKLTGCCDLQCYEGIITGKRAGVVGESTLTLPIYRVGEGLFDRQNCVLTGTKRSGRLMDASDRDPLAYSTNIQQHQGTSLCRLASALPQKPDLSDRRTIFSNVP